MAIELANEQIDSSLDSDLFAVCLTLFSDIDWVIT